MSQPDLRVTERLREIAFGIVTEIKRRGPTAFYDLDVLDSSAEISVRRAMRLMVRDRVIRCDMSRRVWLLVGTLPPALMPRSELERIASRLEVDYGY